ncbi:hypothetical protein F0U63_26790 [Cystobacter fuscus]|nr:hypothetical protein F0U63_26790 [Cystobacter fuscus]
MPGGYSGQAVRPIALRHVMEVARALPGMPLSREPGRRRDETVMKRGAPREAPRGPPLDDGSRPIASRWPRS